MICVCQSERESLSSSGLGSHLSASFNQVLRIEWSPFLRRLHQSSLRGLPSGLVSLADWERLGGGFQWRGVGDKVGARRRWKRPFEFPILPAGMPPTGGQQGGESQD